MPEIVRDLIKIVFGLVFSYIGIKSLILYQVTEKEKKQIRRRATSVANEAWAALREEDLRNYEAELNGLKVENQALRQIIGDQEREIKRWHAMAQAMTTGKGGKIQ